MAYPIFWQHRNKKVQFTSVHAIINIAGRLADKSQYWWPKII